MISVPVGALEFFDQGNTIWVQSPLGGTVMRLKTMGRITTNGECENICSHVDIVVQDDIHICLSEDAKEVTDLERMTQTYDMVGVHYLIEERSEWAQLFLCTAEEQASGDLDKVRRNPFFEFENGKLVSHP